MAKITPVVLDFETYWSATHSLSKINPILYVMHPDTEIISCAIKHGDDVTQTFFGEAEIRKVFALIDWSNALAIAHNMSGFDAMILAWRFGIKPKMWGCTLAMAKPHHGLVVGGSLAKLVEHYKLGVKDNTALLETKGKNLKDFTPDELVAMRHYNRDDTDQCAALFKILLAKTPKAEMKLIDATIRMLVEPKFEVDVPLLEKTFVEEQTRKRKVLVDVATLSGAYVPGMDEEEAIEAARKVLASASKFAKFMHDLGVTVPMKPSPTNPDKQTYALAKTDQEFLALQDHPDELVAMAASARLGVKSTILESRVGKFLDVAAATGGVMPVPLNYYAAHTGRWGGSMELNLQNMPRINPKSPKPTDALRNCLKAPAGYKVVVADLSGIELRVNHFLWKVPSSMALFQADPEKADLYKEFASELYQVERSAVSKEQRQVGKVAHLGLGFGAGAATFQGVAKTMGGVDLSIDECSDVVVKWRSAYPEIAQGWRTCHEALPAVIAGVEKAIDPWGFCVTCPEGIKTPRGMIRYPSLRKEYDGKSKSEWWYGEGRNATRIYAGKITENIVQHLARCILAENALQITKETGFTPALTVHDELIYVVPEAQAVRHLECVQRVMRTPPAWWPELVTWSEGDIADTYGAAK